MKLNKKTHCKRTLNCVFSANFVWSLQNEQDGLSLILPPRHALQT